jgi:WD40 repeat protein
LAVALGLPVAGEAFVADRTGTELARFSTEPGVYMRAVRFDASGQRLITAVRHVRDDPARQGTRVWDLATGDVVLDLDAPSAGLAVDPTGRSIATIRTLDGVADVWDATTGAHVSSLNGAAVSEDIQFSPDGRYIATSAHDGTVRIWDPATGRQQVVLTHDDQVSSSAFSPDGTRIASLTYDGVIRVWTLDLDELVGIALRRVTRDLNDGECRQYLHVDSCADR